MTTSGPHADSLDDFAGDPAAGEVLRRALSARAEEYDGTPLGERFRDVLAGRLHIRQLADDPEFAKLADSTRREFDEYWAGLSPDERTDLVRQGEAVEAEVRRELPE